jgi:hypothetical protein
LIALGSLNPTSQSGLNFLLVKGIEAGGKTKHGLCHFRLGAYSRMEVPLIRNPCEKLIRADYMLKLFQQLS